METVEEEKIRKRREYYIKNKDKRLKYHKAYMKKRVERLSAIGVKNPWGVIIMGAPEQYDRFYINVYDDETNERVAQFISYIACADYFDTTVSKIKKIYKN